MIYQVNFSYWNILNYTFNKTSPVSKLSVDWNNLWELCSIIYSNFLQKLKWISPGSVTHITIHFWDTNIHVSLWDKMKAQSLAHASWISSFFLPIASGLESGSRSANKLNHADMSAFCPCENRPTFIKICLIQLWTSNCTYTGYL